MLALENFREGKYEIILLDINMEKMNGVILYKKIKDIDKNTEVFLFSTTEPKFEEYKSICPSFEERHFIQKPVVISKLL